MKSLTRNILVVMAVFVAASCSKNENLPYPNFIEGVSLRALPSPWTARPRFNLSNGSSNITLSFSSYNASSLSTVDIYVSYLSNTNVPAAAGSGTYANFVAPVTTAGMLLPQFPDSGTAPVTISYSRYDQLVNGVNSSTGATFTALPKFLLRSLSGSDIVSDQNFTMADLAAATGVTLPAAVSAVIANQPAFLLTFVVTKKDASVYSYANSGPGVTANPATGRVVPRTYLDTSVSPAVTKSYNVIISGDEGSPFIPGVSVRIDQ